MPPELMNYLTNLINATDGVLSAFAEFQDRVQEGFDREVPAALPGLDFADAGDLDHLSIEKLQSLFAAYTDLNALMESNNRELWTDMLAVVRSWKR